MNKIILCALFCFWIGIGKGQNNLQYYLDNAAANSPLILDFQNQSEAFRLEAERLKAFYTKPQVTLTAAYMVSPLLSRDSANLGLKYNDITSGNYYGYDLAASNGGIYQALVNLTQPVFNATRSKLFAEQANLQANWLQNNAQLSLHDVEKFVTDQYILCLQDQNQIQYFKNLTSLIQGQLKILEKLTENGIVKQSDLLLIRIEYKTQLTALNTFQATYLRDLMDLNVLAGVRDTSMAVLIDLDLNITPDIALDSKYLIKYKLDSLNFLAARNVFNLKYKPQLNLYANTGLNAVNYRTVSQRFGMSAGVNFLWYIYDGGQKRINDAKASTLIKSTQSYKNIFLVQNKVRKEKALKEIAMLEQRVVLLKSQQDDYTKLLDFYKQELMTGQIPVINYVNILKSAVIVSRDILVLQGQKQLLINTYNYWNW
jgi:outer membrane protein TolC